MALDERLLEILVCPNCKGDVAYQDAQQTITCTGGCGYVYPVRDGIPVLLIDEAVKPDA